MERPKRQICPRCLRASLACICACVHQVQSQTEVLILQHPAETKHVKGSARLLHLCLPNSAIMIAEVFDEAELKQTLERDEKQSVLLYPETTGLPTVSKFLKQESNAIRLVVIDASWRHSRQMLLKNPLLQRLPRYALREVPASRYQIRHAYADDQLSTLEACTYALMQLESDASKFEALLHSFDAFNQMQIEFGVNNLLRDKRK
ncbi:tRNA-uridine aminocarboxypropyltransferase [Undibacterium sp. Di24W]|uniref:tRNA-uridine aminocarboxypropyltransferase n=1 Tax=Undibacterium sp. Di24W TaxID=3413033 RepID=UPI003BF43A8D